MHLRRLLATATVLIAATALGTACGNDDAIGEKLAEKAVEQSGGGDVDVDVDGDDVTISSKDGKESISTSSELPEDWPEELALPDGAKVLGTTNLSGAEGGQVVVNAGVDATPAEVLEHFEGQLDGWKQTASGDFGDGASSLATATWEQGDQTVTLSATGGEDTADTTFVVGLSTK
jgi:hypothetical protein